MNDVGFLASSVPLQRFRATFKNGWNEAEPPRMEILKSVDIDSARHAALARACEQEIVFDVVPLS